MPTKREKTHRLLKLTEEVIDMYNQADANLQK